MDLLFNENEEFVSNRNSTFSHLLFQIMLKFLVISSMIS